MTDMRQVIVLGFLSVPILMRCEPALSQAETITTKESAIAGNKYRQYGAGHFGDLDAVTYSPNGKLVAAECGDDRSVYVWDTKSKELVRIFCTGQRTGWGLAFSPDSRFLAISYKTYDMSQPSIGIWDIATGSCLFKFTGQKPPILSLGFSRSGDLLASAGGKTLFVWSLKQARATARLDKPSGVAEIHSIQFVSDDSLLVTDETCSVYFVSLRSNAWTALFIESERRLTYPVVSVDPFVAIVANNKGRVILVDLERRRPLFATAIDVSRTAHVALSPDHRLLAAASSEAVTIIEIASRQPIIRFAVPSGVTAIAFSPSGEHLAVALFGDKSIFTLSIFEGMDDPFAELSENTERGGAELLVDGAVSPARAYATIRRLTAMPEIALRMCRRHIRRVEPMTAERVDLLIKRLDHPRFQVREDTVRELLSLRESLVPFVERHESVMYSPETRERLTRIIRELSPHSNSRIREGRLIQLLEKLGNRGAVELLRNLATGSADASLTRESKQALYRLHFHDIVVTGWAVGAGTRTSMEAACLSADLPFLVSVSPVCRRP